MVYLGLSLKRVEKLGVLQFEYETLRDIWKGKERWELSCTRILSSTLQNVSAADLGEHREASAQVESEIKKKPKSVIAIELREDLAKFNRLIEIVSGFK